jgi:hypothetical protein
MKAYKLLAALAIALPCVTTSCFFGSDDDDDEVIAGDDCVTKCDTTHDKCAVDCHDATCVAKCDTDLDTCKTDCD